MFNTYKKSGFIKATLLSLIIVVLSTCFAACKNRDTEKDSIPTVSVKTLYNTITLERTASISEYPDGIFEIEAAKGEKDGAQIVFKPTADVAYNVSVSDFVKPDGSVISKDNAVLYVEIYAKTLFGTTNYPAGFWPDGLIPFEYILNKGENKVKAGNNQGLILDISVPRDAKAGLYSGKVTLDFGQFAYEIPVKLTVFDFAIQEIPEMKTLYLVWQHWLIYGELDNSYQKRKDYFDFLLENNIVGGFFPSFAGDVEGFIKDLREYYPKVPNYIIPHRITSATTFDTDLMEKYLYAIGKASFEDGINYYDKALYYIHEIYDECTHDAVRAKRYEPALAVLTNVADLEKKVLGRLKSEHITTDGSEMANALLGIRHVMTTPYDEGLASRGENYFCNGYKNWTTTDSIEAKQDLMKEGQKMGSYTALSGGLSGSIIINDNTISGRDIFWSKYAYGAAMDLYWSVNTYMRSSQLVGDYYGLVYDLYTQASRDGTTNGDGYFLLPGLLYGSEKPFPTIRLMVRRDGIDDYDYMALLEDGYRSLSEKYDCEITGAKSVLQVIQDNVFSLGSSKLNYRGLQDMRRLIADLIEMAHSDMKVVLEDIQLKNNRVEFSILTAPDVVLKVNEITLKNKSTAGEGVRYRGTIDYNQSGELALSATLGSISKTAKITTGKAPVHINGFKDEDDLKKISVSNRNNIKELSSETGFENSIKVTLKGYVFPDNPAYTKAFTPYVYMDVSGVEDAQYITFCVYNPGAEAVVDVVAKDKNDNTYVLDIITLKAHQWTTIKLGNFKKINIHDDFLQNIDRIGFVMPQNLLDEEGNPTEKVFYIKDYYLFRK